MSCPCEQSEQKANCPCDELVHPRPLAIAAGLTSIPRQIAAFPQFRAAMLASAWTRPPLAFWRAREGDDLGLMLLEMWAYVCDVLSFYDETIAHETYLRTARLRPSLRRLVDLLGYVPRPAVAASVKLALLADGRQAVSLPRSTAFRSGAFDSQSPQVFELDTDAQIHPFVNRMILEYPRTSTIRGEIGFTPVTKPSSASFKLGTPVLPHTPVAELGKLDYEPDFRILTRTLLLESGSTNLKPDDPVLIEVQKSPTDMEPTRMVAVVDTVDAVRGSDGEPYQQVAFASPLQFDVGTPLANIRLYRPTQKAALWSSPAIADGDKVFKPSGNKNLVVVLDAVYRQIKQGDCLILTKGSEFRCFEVTNTNEETMKVTAGGPYEVRDKNGNTVTLVAPPVLAPATKLTLSGPVTGWPVSMAPRIVVHYNMVRTGVVAAEGRTSLAASDTLKARDSLERPSGYASPTRFLLEDKNGTGVEVSASLDWNTGVLALGQGPHWEPALTCPVEAYGNVVSVSRGETVKGEILGSGDASTANQSFKLKKKPLTYKSAPTVDNERGVASTLQIYVDGIRWSEVPNFYQAKADAQAYIVRQNDNGESIVIFGDGQHGARLPTGTNNVVATYRYGAGATSPPAGSITQLAKPVKGLKSARNPVAAYDGADAESAQDLRTYAPQSALLLGRAVSIKDMEAAAAGAPGVRAVSVEWRWNAAQQRPVVQVWFIGNANAGTVLNKLHRLSDPSTPISVDPAVAVPAQLALDLEVDERYVVDNVLAAVRTKLMDRKTGILAPEQIGIGRPLYRSRIFQAVLSVPGALTVTEIQWNSVSLTSFAVCPKAGQYFDLEKDGALTLSGKAASHG